MKLKLIERLILILVGTLSFFGHCQSDASFIQLTKPSVRVKGIEQDNLGFIWLYHNIGIYKYDGRDYFSNSSKHIFTNQEPRNYIESVFFDDLNNQWYSSKVGELVKISANNDTLRFKNKNIRAFSQVDTNIWMGSKTGVIYKYNTKASRLDSILSLPRINGFSQYTKILKCYENNLWAISLEGKVYNYSIKDNKLNTIYNANQIYATDITSDKLGRIWVSSEVNGLLIHNEKTSSFENYNNAALLDSNNEIPFFISLFCDTHGNIWAGTDGNGLYKIDLTKNKIEHFVHQDFNPFSINNNTVTELFEDKNSNLWVVGKKGEVSILPVQNENINYYSGSESNMPTPILSILKASDGSLWFGTDGKGLTRVLPNNKKIQYNNSKKGSLHFKANYINRLAEDAKGNIWISTYQSGLWVYNIKTKQFKKINILPSKDKYTINVGVLFKDSKNRIWTWFNDNENTPRILVFSDNLKLLSSFKLNNHGILGTGLNDVTEDESGKIWLAISKGGLFQFNENNTDLNKSTFTKHEYTLEGTNNGKALEISSILPDNNGYLYTLTSSGKLFKFNLKSNSFETLNKTINLDNFFCSSILVEDKNNIWLGSSTGELKHYNIPDNKIISYTQDDGFKNNVYRINSTFKDQDGKLYLGGDFGINAFYSKLLHKKQTHGQLYISEIEILNKNAALVIPEQFKTRVEYIKDLKLTAAQSSFSFSFSSISNNLKPNYHYAYKLSGFDKEWVEPKQEGIASYTNIPHGKYTLEVKAGTQKNIWDIKPIAISIDIAPPWWLSNIAFVGYAALTALLVYGVSLWIKLRNRLHSEKLKFSNEKELYALKMNFFAKMSHEIQTPLTLILGPISDMLERASENGNDLLRQRLLMIKNNASRLSRIALELMAVRNKELNKLKLYISKNNLISDLSNIAQSFSEQAKFKNITLTEDYPNQNITIWYDQEKIEHIFYNLMSNALKFTPVNGNITLKVMQDTKNKMVEIIVSDSGPGIPEDEQKSIFDFLYQSDVGKKTKGMGIGLALAKELVELHRGRISVNSLPEKGTSFSVKLSTDYTTFSEDEKIIIANSKSISNQLDLQDQQDIDLENTTHPLKETVKPKHSLLIVEDNIDMQIFLKDILKNNYNLFIANNGKEGLEIAKTNNLDVIISDVMMPVMDGLEMTKLLKNNKQTAHIPVILLTARNTKRDKVSGLKIGAIEYLRKPFNINELLIKIDNVIAIKERILNKYKTDQHSIPTSTNKLRSKNDLFLENLTQELNQQLFNTDFKLEDLPKTMNMSYSAIYRKCHDVTGKTPVELIRKLKLKKAAILILKNNYNVSEAAFMVGYKDSKYFSKCFKEEFKKTPSALKREVEKSGIDVVLEKYQFEKLK